MIPVTNPKTTKRTTDVIRVFHFFKCGQTDNNPECHMWMPDVFFDNPKGLKVDFAKRHREIAHRQAHMQKVRRPYMHLAASPSLQNIKNVSDVKS